MLESMSNSPLAESGIEANIKDSCRATSYGLFIAISRMKWWLLSLLKAELEVFQTEFAGITRGSEVE